MYKLLAFPSEVEAGDRMIRGASDIATPPDFEDWFNERKFYYSRFGLIAHILSNELSEKYSIQKKVYNDWNPSGFFQKELSDITKTREIRFEGHRRFVESVLGKKQA